MTPPTPHSRLLCRPGRLGLAGLPILNLHPDGPVPVRRQGGQVADIPRHGRKLHAGAVRAGLPAGEVQHDPGVARRRRLERLRRLRLRGRQAGLRRRQPDPWLDGCYHSNLAPQRYSSDLHPSHLIVDGGHHWDSYGILDVPGEPQFVREAHYWEIRTVRRWLRDFSSWSPASAGSLVARRSR